MQNQFTITSEGKVAPVKTYNDLLTGGVALDLQGFNDNRKKTLCHHFLKGSCSLGSACNFAHGKHDLQTAVVPPPPVCEAATKTKLCLHFQRGHCSFGERCNFAHGRQDLKQMAGIGRGHAGSFVGAQAEKMRFQKSLLANATKVTEPNTVDVAKLMGLNKDAKRKEEEEKKLGLVARLKRKGEHSAPASAEWKFDPITGEPLKRLRAETDVVQDIKVADAGDVKVVCDDKKAEGGDVTAALMGLGDYSDSD